jgi:hypothetical protein
LNLSQDSNSRVQEAGILTVESLLTPEQGVKLLGLRLTWSAGQPLANGMGWPDKHIGRQGIRVGCWWQPYLRPGFELSMPINGRSLRWLLVGGAAPTGVPL